MLSTSVFLQSGMGKKQKTDGSEVLNDQKHFDDN